jgi:hypothetical protein
MDTLEELTRQWEAATSAPAPEALSRALARATGVLAAYCEHAEHNEPHSVESTLIAASCLRTIGTTLTSCVGTSVLLAYERRIEQVELASLHALSEVGGEREAPGAAALRQATSWFDVQIAQSLHDRRFHPDVFGLSKADQLRHYVLHVAKLSGLFVEAIDAGKWRDFALERGIDIVIFGVKIATCCNARLSGELADDADGE